MTQQLVPNVFFPSIVPVPASQLDTNFNYVSGKFVSVKDAAFGAKGDGVTDDYAAINAAIVYAQSLGAGTRLLFPRGTYLLSQGVTISGTPIQIEGEGSASALYSPVPATTGTLIKYSGAVAATTLLNVVGLQSSMRIRALGLDGGGIANTGLVVDTCTFGIYDDISIRNCQQRAFTCRSTQATGQSCSWNTFRNFNIDIVAGGTICAVWVTGNGNTNSCHNTFQDFHVNFGGAAGNGINLGYCDNNRFIGMYLFRAAGAGAGVNVIDNEGGAGAGFPLGNYFVHLQASAGGWVQQATATGWNVVLGYSRANGEPAPVTNSTGNTNGHLLVLDSWGAFNCVFGGPNPTALGGGDTRSALVASLGTSPNIAQINVGATGTSDNFYGANTHHFLDGSSANELTIAAGALTAPGVISTTKYLSTGSSNAAQSFGKGASLAANAELDITNPGAGLYTIRNVTNGQLSVLSIDVPAGAFVVINDAPGWIAVGADPGAGSSKFWVTSTGTTLRIVNRFATTKQIAVAALTTNGTPS